MYWRRCYLDKNKKINIYCASLPDTAEGTVVYASVLHNIGIGTQNVRDVSFFTDSNVT